MKNLNPALWALLDEFRSQTQHHSMVEILKVAVTRGIGISYNDLRNLAWRDGTRAGTFIYPEYIIEFVISYFKESNPKVVLDCYARTADVLSPLVQRYTPTVAIGMNQSKGEYEIAQLIQPNKSIEWQLGDPLTLLDGITNNFDAITGSPPFNSRSVKYSFRAGNQEIELLDDYAAILLLKASLLLNESGSALFVFPPGFLFRREERRVISNLQGFGLYIDAVLHLPSGTFGPTTQIPGLLVVVRRGLQQKLFVGEITSEATQQEVLLRNLKARKEGKSPQLGLLVDFDSFRSFPALVEQFEIANLERTLGFPAVKLLELCAEVNLPKRKHEAEFADLPNAVYLPIIGNSSAVARQEDLRIKPQNYIQLVIDSEKAIAAYVAHFFNTPLGQKVRESIATGVIPKITKSNLSGATVYLPDMDTQIAVISTYSAITDISSKMDTLRRELLNQPRRYKEIQKALKAMQPNNDFEKWLDSLPFPISSILWTYNADANTEHKVEHLFLFFEALSEFLAVMMLSAYASDRDFYTHESVAWVESDPKYKDWVITSDFGGWRVLCERLAKVTRKLLGEKGKRELCLKLFGNPSTEFLDMLTSKSLYGILREVNEYRNQWKGHSGALSMREHQQHLSLLQSNLSEIRKIMQDKWEGALLLSPGSNEYGEGLFDYQVQALVGTRTP